jgi:hypothetical protein
MWAAHMIAIALGAVLIAAGDRLCRALSRAITAAVRRVLPPAARPFAASREADQPLHSTLLLAVSVSHRGPPVSFAH